MHLPALAAHLLAAGLSVAPGPTLPGSAREALRPERTRAVNCRPTSAQRCSLEGCELANEGLHAEQFDLDAVVGTVGACLYTDCFAGAARVVRDPEHPWVVTGFGRVRSSRPKDGVPPPGGAPFPLTVTVDLRTGRFSAIWSLSPDGLQVDFGTCDLRGPG
jgi:hypothetical protein